MAADPVISVIIPTLDRETYLLSTLQDVLTQECTQFEIIVVDQSETPARNLDSRIRHIHTRPPHLTRARNIGLNAAGGEIVVFVDDDVALSPDFLAAHSAAYHANRVGGVAGRVIVGPDPVRPLVRPGPSGKAFDWAVPREVFVARGCNMSFRKSALLTAGSFDEHFSSAGYGEEEDMCFAIRRLGLQVLYSPEAWLVHREAERGGTRSAGAKAADRSVFYRDKMYFALKNLGGLDFGRVLWDTYKHALPPRASGLHIFERQLMWAKGSLTGLNAFRKYGSRRHPLPYRMQ